MTVSFYSKRMMTKPFQNETEVEVIRHTVSLTFNKIDESLTGMYTCNKALKYTGDGVYIYGGSGALLFFCKIITNELICI